MFLYIYKIRCNNFQHIFSRYNKNDKVLYLNKAFYGLPQSLLFWQQKLINKLKKLDLKENFQKLCIVEKNGIIRFFYINDLFFTYQKD